MKTLTFAIGIAIVIAIGAVWLYALPQARPITTPTDPINTYTSTSDTPLTQSGRFNAPTQPATATTATTPQGTPTTTAATRHTIEGAEVVPSEIVAGSPQPLTFTALISDPDVIATSVNLIEITSAGSSTVLGRLEPIGNGTFTLATSMPTLPAGILHFRISAAFYGALKRVQTPAFPFAIAPAIDTSGWTSLFPGGYLTMKLPADMHIVDDPSSGGYDTQTFDIELPDGTVLAWLYIYTPQQWTALQQLTTDAAIPVLLSQGNAFVVGYSVSENDGNMLDLNEGIVLRNITQALATLRAQ